MCAITASQTMLWSMLYAQGKKCVIIIAMHILEVFEQGGEREQIHFLGVLLLLFPFNFPLPLPFPLWIF